MCVRGVELRCVPDLEIGVRIIGEAGRVEGDGVQGTGFSSFCTGVGVGWAMPGGANGGNLRQDERGEWDNVDSF
jgi:hypothetical protein